MNMFKSNKKKKILTCSVLLFSFLSITIFANFNFEPTFHKDDAIKDDFTSFPKTSDSLPSFKGVGDKVNISLHQSYLNNSFNTALSPSDPNNNSFSLPCPTDLTFNSSYTRFEVEDIVAPNKSIIVETGTTNDDPVPNGVSFSFEVPGNSTLVNISICFSETDTVNNVAPFIGVYLYRAIWDTGAQTMRHNTVIATIDGNFQIDDDVTAKWYNFTNIDETLDVTDTNNNTFFIYISQNTPTSQALVEFHNENDGAIDDSIVWWNFFSWGVQNKDPSMRIDLSPLNNTPRPEQVNLRINNNSLY